MSANIKQILERGLDRNPDRGRECDAVLEPAGGVVPLAAVLDLGVTCTTPATVLMEFWCGKGHRDQNAKCDAHSRNDGTQWCGYCAENGQREAARVRVIRPL